MVRMSRLKYLGCLLSLYMTGCASVCAEQYACIHNHWYIVGDAIFMRRSEIHKKPLVKDTLKVRSCPGECDDFTVLDTQDVAKHFDFEPGFRAALLYSMDIRNTLEAVYLWVRPWHADRKVNSDQGLFFPFNISEYAFDYFQASNANAKYHSRFWDAELNYWRHFSPRYVDYFSLSGVLGLRYFHLNEGFKLTFVKPPDRSHYSIHTHNDIGAVQIGLNLQMAPTCRIGWDFTGKVGVMYNRAQQRNVLLDLDDTVALRRVKKHTEWQWGLFADVLAQAGFQLFNWFNVHAGYQFMVLSGLALAPEQVRYGTGTETGKGVYTDGYAFIHGFFAGGTFCF